MLYFTITFALGSDFRVGEQNIIQQELPNGLDLIWIDDGSPQIDLYTVYAAGSYMDDKMDLAHMTEHSMFCTKDGAFDVLVSPYTESSNAYTRAEHTTYYNTSIEPKDFLTVIEYEFNRMNELAADEECFAYEYGRLIKEVELDQSILSKWDRERRSLLFQSSYGRHCKVPRPTGC